MVDFDCLYRRVLLVVFSQKNRNYDLQNYFCLKFFVYLFVVFLLLIYMFSNFFVIILWQQFVFLLIG